MTSIGVMSVKDLDALTVDKIYIEQRENQPYILDLDNFQRLYLQTIPGEIEVGGDSQFATVGTMGRNTPFYHYTGAEEVVKFSISWYSLDDRVKDVLTKCKWLYSLSRRDGEKGIHTVMFSMGEMFKDSKWIIEAAPYTLRHFHRKEGMLPLVAVSNITLKKITDQNLTHSEMRKLGI